MKSTLLVISGLPGVGKTTVGRLIAEQSQSFHLSVDPVHDALLSTGLADCWNVGVGAYESVRVMTEANLLLGRCVVVDVVNDSEPARETRRTAARRTGSELVFVLLTRADEDEHRRRLEERERGHGHLPEPTRDEVQKRSAEYPEWTDNQLVVDISHMNPDEVSDRIVEYVAEFRFNVDLGR